MAAKHSIIRDRTFAFAVQIVALHIKLKDGFREYEISSQLIRSGTAPGVLCREAQFAESKADFIHKLKIGLKEANEALYWLDLIHVSFPSLAVDVQALKSECSEIMAILVASVKTLKGKS